MMRLCFAKKQKHFLDINHIQKLPSYEAFVDGEQRSHYIPDLTVKLV